MTPEKLVEILGERTVKQIEDACTTLFAVAQCNRDQVMGMEAARELILQMLYAAIITPRSGAHERSKHCCAGLIAIVHAATTGQTGAQ
jgi:hypothetical protein